MSAGSKAEAICTEEIRFNVRGSACVLYHVLIRDLILHTVLYVEYKLVADIRAEAQTQYKRYPPAYDIVRARCNLPISTHTTFFSANCLEFKHKEPIVMLCMFHIDNGYMTKAMAVGI